MFVASFARITCLLARFIVERKKKSSVLPGWYLATIYTKLFSVCDNFQVDA